MTTLASEEMLWFSRAWERGIDSALLRDDAATQSGIVGDAAHRLEGGYHISREDQPASNYSVGQFSDDRLGRSDLASAVDMTMSPEGMKLVTSRLVEAWHRQDPRLDNVRGFNGTLDGVHAIRKDAIHADPFRTDESTVSHLWHVHLELFRRFADDMQTMKDVLSVILGATVDGVEEMAQKYLDYSPNTTMAILVGETPDLGYPDASGPDWDDTAVLQHSVKAVEARLMARLGEIEAKIALPPTLSAEDVAAAIIRQLAG